MPLSDFLGQVATAFGAAPESAHKHMWSEIAPWLRNLMVHAGPKWLPRLGIGIKCTAAHSDPCQRSAVAACDVCQRACCLNHSRIDQYGDAICYFCIADAIQRARQGGTQQKPPPWPFAGANGQQQQQPPQQPRGPSDQELSAARKVLGVKKSENWETIDARYKYLLAKHHPDKFMRQPDGVRAEHEQKFKQIRAAYDLLKKTQSS